MSDTKERPILFSAPMVRAILEGRKTQTRRIIKPQPGPSARLQIDWHKDEVYANGLIADCQEFPIPVKWNPGDTLWVRESWGWSSFASMRPTPTYKQFLKYRADGEVDEGDCKMRWRPSIHMPRWASRITLKVVSVRVERVQDITEDDAIAEGIPMEAVGHYIRSTMNDRDRRANSIHLYSLLWDSINGPESWQSNPWVWVISFEVVK